MFICRFGLNMDTQPTFSTSFYLKDFISCQIENWQIENPFFCDIEILGWVKVYNSIISAKCSHEMFK